MVSTPAPPPGSMPGVAAAFPPEAGTHPDSESTPTLRLADSPYMAMLERIALYVHPPRSALKAGIPPVNSLANKLAKLSLYSLDVPLSERRNILTFVYSQRLRGVVSRTVSASLQLETAERLKVLKEFNDLVKEVLQAFNAWRRSWNAVPKPGIPPMEAAKQLSQEAFFAAKRSDIPWDILIFAFGRAPELWDLSSPDSSSRSEAEASGALVGGKGKAPDIPHVAPLAQLEESFAVTDVEPMVVDDEPLDWSDFLLDTVDPDLARDAYPVHRPSAHLFPDSPFGVTIQAMGSGEGAIHNTTSARRATPISEAQTTNSAPGVPTAIQSTLPDETTVLFQHQDLTTFLSAYGLLALLPGSELHMLLDDALRHNEEFKAADYEELTQAMAKVLRRLREFRQVHGELVRKLWGLVRHARQWHTWGLEVQYFYEKHGVNLSPEALSKQRTLFTFINGYTILLLQLIHQQAGFQPPEA